MSLSLILACLWAIVGTITAFLPMRAQMVPGISLLVSLPFLLGFLGYQHGIWVTLAVTAAAISLFRRPLMHLGRWLIWRIGGRKGPSPTNEAMIEMERAAAERAAARAKP